MPTVTSIEEETTVTPLPVVPEPAQTDSTPNDAMASEATPDKAAQNGATVNDTGEHDMTAIDISQLRGRIDELDAGIIALWRERSTVSKEIGARRIASGGTRIVLAREQEVIQKFHSELGPIGAQVAMLLLRSGRGAL